MGAWGHRSFENDSALDWLGELVDGDAAALAEVLEAVGGAGDDEYIEVDAASAALAAAELVAAAIGKGGDRLNEEAGRWLADHREAALEVGAAAARRAVERVLRRSELRELWDESGDAGEWHADVRELLHRLA